MRHVFVSYSKHDNDFVQLLKTELEKRSLTTWLALENLKGGEEWREGIDSAIRSAYAMVIVISPDSDASKYVTYEWAFAYGVGVPIVPVRYRQVDNLHPRLEGL